MKTAVLANSSRAGMKLLASLSGVPDNELFLVLFPRGRFCSLQKDIFNIFSAFFSPFALLFLKLIFRRKFIFLRHALDHPASLKILRGHQFDVGLHKANVIYRESSIACFRTGILNSHIGLLPKYRGRCVMEWSLLNNDPTGISVYFIDSGIDTGERMIFTRQVDLFGYKKLIDAKQSLFNLDGETYREALNRLRAGDYAYQKNDGAGKRYYVMSNLFLSVAEQALPDNRSGIS